MTGEFVPTYVPSRCEGCGAPVVGWRIIGALLRALCGFCLRDALSRQEAK